MFGLWSVVKNKTLDKFKVRHTLTLLREYDVLRLRLCLAPFLPGGSGNESCLAQSFKLILLERVLRRVVEWIRLDEVGQGAKLTPQLVNFLHAVLSSDDHIHFSNNAPWHSQSAQSERSSHPAT